MQLRSFSSQRMLRNFNTFQMLTNVRRTSMLAAHWLPVKMCMAVTIAPACQVTPVMDLPVQVSIVTAIEFLASLLTHSAVAL